MNPALAIAGVGNGAQIALAFAASHPEKVARLMLDFPGYDKWYWQVMESKLLKQVSPTEYVVYVVHRAPAGLPERDVFKDFDGDGVLDRADQCPAAPEDFDGHEDADGCPDTLPPSLARFLDQRVEFGAGLAREQVGQDLLSAAAGGGGEEAGLVVGQAVDGMPLLPGQLVQRHAVDQRAVQVEQHGLNVLEHQCFRVAMR